MGENLIISVSGANSEMRLLVRSIPEIFDYSPCSYSFVKENEPYDWAFMKKHILYFLDMQVNRVANHPDFKDLATVGYWGAHYSAKNCWQLLETQDQELTFEHCFW